MSDWKTIKEKCSFSNGEMIQVSIVDEYIQQLEAEKAAAVNILSEFENVKWGWDGDCGSQIIIDSALELLKEKE